MIAKEGNMCFLHLNDEQTKKLFLQFTNLSLFLMSFGLILISIINNEARNFFINFFVEVFSLSLFLREGIHPGTIFSYFFIFVFILGYIYSIVFVLKKKTFWFKYIMLFYAVILNVIVAGNVFFYYFDINYGLSILTLVPGIHLLSTFVFFAIFMGLHQKDKYNLSSLELILNDKPNYYEFAFSISVLFLCIYLFDTFFVNWVMTYSFGLYYSILLNGPFIRVLEKVTSK